MVHLIVHILVNLSTIRSSQTSSQCSGNNRKQGVRRARGLQTFPSVPKYPLKILHRGNNERSKKQSQTMVTVHSGLWFGVTDPINLTNLRWAAGWMHQYQGWIPWILRLRLKLVLRFRIILILDIFTANDTERPYCINALTSEIWWDMEGDYLYVLIILSCLMEKVDDWPPLQRTFQQENSH